MWIMLNNAFLSIVAAEASSLKRAGIDAHPDNWLSVRARKAGHITSVFPDVAVMSWPGRDYAARAFVRRDDVEDAIAKQVQAIDYPNFKDSVKEQPLHDAYLGVWCVMHDYQSGAYDKRWENGDKSAP